MENELRSLFDADNTQSVHGDNEEETRGVDGGKSGHSPQSNGFYEGVGTIDSKYTLNYLVNRNLHSQKGKLIETLVDFKAAFPLLYRGMLWRVLRERN